MTVPCPPCPTVPKCAWALSVKRAHVPYRARAHTHHSKHNNFLAKMGTAR